VGFPSSMIEGIARGWAALAWHLARGVYARAAFDTVEVKISGPLSARVGPGSLLQARQGQNLTHRRLLELFEGLAADPKIKRVIFHFGATGLSLARAQELARALRRLREAGKILAAYCETISAREYLLAAQCEKIYLAPMSVLMLTGLNMEMTFLRGLLDKAGVEPDLLVVGKFKSAAETFTRKTAGEAAREMTEGLLDDLYAQLAADLAAALGKTAAQVKKIIDEGPYTADRAVKAGLIHGAGYRDRLLADLEIKGAGTIVSGAKYLRLLLRRRQRRARMLATPRVALVHLDGTIHEGRGDPTRGRPGAGGYVRLFRALTHNKEIKAVVLRVASPGGVAGGSDLMRHELQLLAKKKPLVVSLGDVGASGGYLVALPGRPVLAENATLTGSIGVFAGKFDLSGLLAKVGVSVDTHRRGAAAGLLSPLDRFSDVERRRMKEILTATYRGFKDAVAEGRDLSKRQVQAAAEGRVWTGREAKEKGLIDDIGGLGEALARAKELVGCPAAEPLRLDILPAVPGPWRMLLNWSGGQALLPEPLHLLTEAREWTRGPYAGLPMRIEIK